MDGMAKGMHESSTQTALRELDIDESAVRMDEDGQPNQTVHDKRDMRRLGRIQEVKRRFRFFSIIGYMVVLGATWESALISLVFSLGNGGTAGAIWLTLIACAGMFVTCLSMAEVNACVLYA